MIGTGYEVLHDLYSISDRIKEIDAGYFIFFNYKKKRYEVHNAYQRGNTLSLVLPYSVLDARTVELVRKTRSERAKELFAQMEEENEKRQKEELEALTKKAESRFEEEMQKAGV